MPSSPPVRSGPAELRRLLETQTRDVRALDVEGFRGWLGWHLARWQRDPVFVQRVRIRELRRAHPRLRELEREERRARVAYEASPQFGELEALGRELGDVGKALTGLRAALEGADPERQARLREKLAAFEGREGPLRERRARRAGESGAGRELARLSDELARLRRELGMDALEARLHELQRARGRRSGRSGAGFEDLAAAAIRSTIVPRLGLAAGERERVRVLRGVTLGAARTEIDALVVLAPLVPGDMAEVLALVEAKRNLNDLAHGFARRQENLAWLAGDRDRYDADAYRTRGFPGGHFDRAAAHEEDGERFLVGPRSFRRFPRDPSAGWFLDGLWLITRAGPVWGLGGQALSRLSHRIAMDVRWEPESDAYLADLLAWCRSLAAAVETPDVLRLFAEREDRAGQILLIDA